MEQLLFKNFLKSVENAEFDTNTTALGVVTIQQSARNRLRREGVEALKADLMALYGDEIDVLETKEGIVLAVENEPGDFTFSWELKSTIKSLDYDPFIEANNYDEELAVKEEKRIRKEQEKELREATLAAKRARKLAELEKRKELTEQQMELNWGVYASLFHWICVRKFNARRSSEMTQVKQEKKAKATIKGKATTLQMRRQTSGINAT